MPADVLTRAREKTRLLVARGDHTAARLVWLRAGRALVKARGSRAARGAVSFELAAIDRRRGAYKSALGYAKRAISAFTSRHRDTDVLGARVDALCELGA